MASRKNRVISLAVLGTLVDDRSGLARGLEAQGLAPDAARALGGAALDRMGPLIEELEAFVPWEVLLVRALRLAAGERGLQLDESTARAAVSRMADWPLFDDVVPALASLAPAYRLALVSNLDQRRLEVLARRLDVGPLHLVGADRVGCFLPEPDHLMALIHELEVDEDRVLQVSARPMEDLLPAEGLGVAHAWVHRSDERGPGEVEIQIEAADLAALARRLTRRGRRRG
ncbi:MAG: hypothetical protein Q9Q40_13210 [Acidobacteriota bacterium]|nr:hypothetical protein [Acidobacteriota bacterium]MDQ7086883.1 hypothetical protein [Acidobacteriota bacterium]